MNYGDLGKRIVASIIDSIVLSAIGFLLGLLLSFAGVIIAPLVSWLYYILLEGGSWHATLGKRMMGLYVADADGNGIKYSTAILRMIGKMLSGLILGIGYIIGFFNDSKQCLHDMIAKTYVLNGKAEDVNSVPIYENNQTQMHDAYGNQPELVGISGPLAGRTYQVGQNGLSIGRDSIACQVVVPSSQANVSRVHCYVTFNSASGMFVVNDRNSTHGTFTADGRKISNAQPMALKSGDRFYLAVPENMFEVR